MKHVKKSMFISTVLMVVMLIAALSTATFAWYTSNNTAASTSTMVGAAAAQDANIGIGFFAGAQANEINFHSLVDLENKGYLTPVVPAAYYDPAVTSIRDTTLTDHYTTSTVVQQASAGYIAGGVNGSDYRRVVQLTNNQRDEIVAQSGYVHSWSANPKILTNITTGEGGFNGNYEMIYYVPYYVYNNSKAVNTTNPPIAVGDPITVGVENEPYRYELAANEPAANTKVYTIQRIYEVATDGATTAAAAKAAGVTKVTQDCANQLSRESRSTGFIPQAGTYLVMYWDYQIAPYTTPVTVENEGTDDEIKKVPTIDANAVFVGYAGDVAATLNLAENDIQENQVKWSDNPEVHTYPKITEIKYDEHGFAYLYKTYTAGTYTSVTNKVEGAINWSNFAFTKANIDNVGFFKGNGSSASTGNYYEGNSQSMSNNHYDLGVVTGISATASGNATETFYITNNGSTRTGLKVSLDVKGDNASMLRIAIFKNGLYYGTLSAGSNAPTTFGKILIGSKAADMQTYKAQNQIVLGELNPGALNAAEFQLVAWFDGTLLNDVAAAKNCSFSLTFEAGEYYNN